MSAKRRFFGTNTDFQPELCRTRPRRWIQRVRTVRRRQDQRPIVMALRQVCRRHVDRIYDRRDGERDIACLAGAALRRKKEGEQRSPSPSRNIAGPELEDVLDAELTL